MEVKEIEVENHVEVSLEVDSLGSENQNGDIEQHEPEQKFEQEQKVEQEQEQNKEEEEEELEIEFNENGLGHPQTFSFTSCENPDDIEDAEELTEENLEQIESELTNFDNIDKECETFEHPLEMTNDITEKLKLQGDQDLETESQENLSNGESNSTSRDRTHSIFESLSSEELKQRMEESTLDNQEFLNFSKWVTCFCIVTFDIELGQALETVYPPIELTEKEQSNIRCTSFPDSNSGLSGDVNFTFRMRKDNAPILPGHKGSVIASHRNTYLYGYTFFRQKKDETLKRGYFQKSVVLLSYHNYDGLFKEIINILAPLYFDVGKPLLEAACRNIAAWDSPVPGKSYELPFLGRLMQVEIPPLPLFSDWLPPAKSKRISNDIMVNIKDEKLYRCFREVLPDIWLFWELALLCEPIVIISPSPSLCSDAVMALTNIIQPVPFGGEIRPYFTVQDSDYKEFTTRTKPPPDVLLGVTNPYFIKALEHWPNVISIGNENKPQKANRSSSLDLPSGIKTKYQPFLIPEKKLLKRIEEMTDIESIEELLMRHFAELTQNFLLPFERYFQTLIPVPRTISPWRACPKIKVFQVDAFLKFLQEIGPQIQISSKRKSEWILMYRRFLRSGNFKSWFRTRMRQAEKGVKQYYLRTLANADISAWMKGKYDVELVDCMIRIEEQLRLSKLREYLDDAHIKKLQSHVQVLIEGFPEDLRLSVLASIESKKTTPS